MGYFFSLFSLSKSATATALNWSELILFIFGIVLVAGLVGEYKTPDPHSRRMKLFEMLVIIGVLGELVGDGGIFLFSHQLQVISDNEIAEANKNALDAASSAKTAHEEADAVKITASQARAWVLRLGPRINNFDSQKFTQSLTGIDPKKVDIVYEPDNEEAYELGRRIASTLRPRWRVSEPHPITEKDAFSDLSPRGAISRNVPLLIRAGGSRGLGIIANPRDSTTADGLREALANSGAFVTLQSYPERTMPDGIVRIVVGKHFP